MGTALESLLLSGNAAFLPKHLEVLFHITAGEPPVNMSRSRYNPRPGSAAQLVGLFVVPAGAGANLLGGWLVRRLRLDRDRILALCCAIQVALDSSSTS